MKSQDFHPPRQPQSRGILLRSADGVRAHREGWRRGVHLACGAPAFLLRDFPLWLVASLAAFLLLGYWFSVALRMQLPIMRSGERWVSGAVTYWLGVFLALALLPPEAAAVGWVVLAVGDPMAAWTGAHYPLVQLRPRRSLGGSLAFVLFAAASAGALVAFWHGAAAIQVYLLAVVTAAVAGAIVEFLCMRWDDNLFIPVFSGGAYLLVAPGMASM